MDICWNSGQVKFMCTSSSSLTEMWWGTLKDTTGKDTCLRFVSVLPSHSPFFLYPVLGLSLWLLCLSLNMFGKSGELYELLWVWFVLTCWSCPTSMFYSAKYPHVLNSGKRSSYIWASSAISNNPAQALHLGFLHLFPKPVNYDECLYPCHYKPPP